MGARAEAIPGVVIDALSFPVNYYLLAISAPVLLFLYPYLASKLYHGDAKD